MLMHLTVYHHLVGISRYKLFSLLVVGDFETKELEDQVHCPREATQASRFSQPCLPRCLPTVT